MMQKKRKPIRTVFSTSLAIGFGALLIVSLWLAAHQRPGVAQARGVSEMVGEAEVWAGESIFKIGSSLAVDSEGRPHISYVEVGYRTFSSRLRYAAELEPGLWQFETLTNWGDLVGDATSLVLDDEGNPHIAFTHNGRLTYARRIDGSWQIDGVDGVLSSGDALVLILDSAWQPQIVSSGGGIVHANRTEQGWQSSEIPIPGADNRFLALALDKDDRPHVGFMSEFMDPAEVVHGILHYAYLQDDVWYTEDADYGGGGWYPALALDSMGRAHFSYQSGGYDEFGGNYQLSYAQRTTAAPAPGEWQIEEIDMDDEGESMLLLDEDGRPHISYTTYDRMYATKGEAGWQTLEVDYRFGKCISDELWELDSIGRPVLACVNEGMELITWSPMPKYLLWMPVMHRQ